MKAAPEYRLAQDDTDSVEPEPEIDEEDLNSPTPMSPDTPNLQVIGAAIDVEAQDLERSKSQADVAAKARWHAFGRCGKCVGLASGVVFALGGHGIFQERIMSVPYDGEYFRTSAFLVLCNRLIAVAFAASSAHLQGESLRIAVPAWKYVFVSIGNVIAAMCQYEALKWVSFPVQLLGKSFKMIPVMLWAIVMSKKQFKTSDWLFSAGITGGVVAFMLTGNISAPGSAKSDSIYGILLLALFIAADSFTSTFQEKLFKEHKTTKYNQMLYVNAFSAIISFVGVVGTGDLLPVLRFCVKHPQLISDATAISAASVTGQFFIVSMVKEFGALALAATMNVRQLISIVISTHIYGHEMTGLQVLALIVVFAAMFLKSLMSMRRQMKKSTQKYEQLQQEETKQTNALEDLQSDKIGVENVATVVGKGAAEHYSQASIEDKQEARDVIVAKSNVTPTSELPNQV